MIAVDGRFNLQEARELGTLECPGIGGHLRVLEWRRASEGLAWLLVSPLPYLYVNWTCTEVLNV